MYKRLTKRGRAVRVGILKFVGYALALACATGIVVIAGPELAAMWPRGSSRPPEPAPLRAAQNTAPSGTAAPEKVYVPVPVTETRVYRQVVVTPSAPERRGSGQPSGTPGQRSGPRGNTGEQPSKPVTPPNTQNPPKRQPPPPQQPVRPPPPFMVRPENAHILNPSQRQESKPAQNRQPSKPQQSAQPKKGK